MRLLHPRYWGYHAVVVVAVVVAGLLGLWQYHGWQDRREDAARDLTNVAPIPLADAIGPDDPFPGKYVGQPVEVTGRWSGDVVAITDREHDGRDGIWVVELLDVHGSLLPVVRGWTDATDMQLGAREDGEVTLTGWLQPSESTGATDADPTDASLPQLRIADLAQRFDQDLYGAYVVERDPPPPLVQADLDQLPDASRFTAIRNLLYAFEWWFFGAFAVFVWWRWARETAEAAAEETSAPR